MGKRIRVAQTNEIRPGTGKVVEAGGRDVALFNVDGSFYAIDNTCPHVEGPLGEGQLQGDCVACPWHGATFNVKTGQVTSPPAKVGVKTFPVHVDSGNVYVEVD
jgi:nitrite reductase (NADH) small subunit